MRREPLTSIFLCFQNNFQDITQKIVLYQDKLDQAAAKKDFVSDDCSSWINVRRPGCCFVQHRGYNFFSLYIHEQFSWRRARNGVLLLLCLRTNSESQCGKVIHKKSVGKAGNSKNSNFPLSPLIFYVLLSRIDFQSSSVKIIITKPHCRKIEFCDIKFEFWNLWRWVFHICG